MPFYLRKSVKLGPLRLNFSKSGIGYSIGVKGFRVGEDARGRGYLHAGRRGFYFRQTLTRRADAQQSADPRTRKKREWLLLPLGAGLLVVVLGVFLPAPSPFASGQRPAAGVTPPVLAGHDGEQQSVPRAPEAPPGAKSGAESADQAADELQEPQASTPPEPSPFKAALVAYRVTFDQAGRPLAQQVHRLQTAAAPASEPGACIEVLRSIDEFRATALPAPSEEVTFALTNALARYHEAMVGCSRGDDDLVRQRLRMGMNLWLRATARLTGLVAQDEPEQAVRGPASVEELFSSIPPGDPPTPQVQFRFQSGGSSSGRARTCCKVCDKGQPCGNSCISWRYTCRQPPGCAC